MRRSRCVAGTASYWRDPGDRPVGTAQSVEEQLRSILGEMIEVDVALAVTGKFQRSPSAGLNIGGVDRRVPSAQCLRLSAQASVRLLGHDLAFAHDAAPLGVFSAHEIQKL
mgnify:CR=1 FL=1